jgi:hypothetical protein
MCPPVGSRSSRRRWAEKEKEKGKEKEKRAP